jgi:hypothetical protein
MKLSPSLLALALISVVVPAPVAIDNPEIVARDAADYGTYPTPAGGYGTYPAPAGGYGSYPAPEGGYTTYAAPAGGYKTYGRAISDMIKRLWSR